MKYTAPNGTTVNIPDSLGPKQVAQIKALADQGMAKKAGKLAKELKAKKANNQAKKPSEGGIAGTVTAEGIIKPGKADTAIQAKEAQDVQTNFDLATPGSQTDVYGNTQTVTRDPVTGEVKVVQGMGDAAGAFRNAAVKAAGTFGGDVSRQSAYDADFNLRSKYLDRNMARDMEATKQELANRGIPYNPAEEYNPNTKNLWGRTIGGIRENYQGQYADAANQATLSGNAAYSTDASARDSFINSAMGAMGTMSPRVNAYQGTSTDTSGIGMDIMNLTAAQAMAKYGIDKDAYLKEKQIASQEGVAHAQIAASKAKGGGGGGGGFEIVG